MKVCSQCKQEKDEADFNAHAAHRDGLSSACRDCDCATRRKRYWLNPEKSREYDRAYRQKTPGFKRKIADYQREHRYGISPRRYAEMLQEQGGVCAICKFPYPSLCVDHCHKTTGIRGLLCQSCNSALGYLKDLSVNALAAAEYLIKHGK